MTVMLERAKKLIYKIDKVGEHLWKVGDKYLVAEIDGSFFCTCPYFEKKGKNCKHIYAVLLKEANVVEIENL